MIINLFNKHTMMKICRKCGRELPLNEFYKHPAMADGYFNVCKRCKNEYHKEYCKKNKEKIIEYTKQYYEENKKYFKQYYEKNKDFLKENQKKYKKENKEHKKEYMKLFRKTPIGRAFMLLYGYNKSDREKNRGQGDLTVEWILENILFKPCAHCGETDWRKLGCNRLDNSKPHTKDNVEPCCWECGRKQPRK